LSKVGARDSVSATTPLLRVSVGEVGVTRADASGPVYNLVLEDVKGNCTWAHGGGEAVAMQGQNGVGSRLEDPGGAV
jgi:hypothetical protein